MYYILSALGAVGLEIIFIAFKRLSNNISFIIIADSRARTWCSLHGLIWKPYTYLGVCTLRKIHIFRIYHIRTILCITFYVQHPIREVVILMICILRFYNTHLTLQRGRVSIYYNILK